MMKKEFLFLLVILIFPALSFSMKPGSYTIYKTDSRIIYGICFSDKGGVLGIADNNEIKVYSARENVLLNEFKNGHNRQILTINISKDSTLLVSGGKDSTVVVWDFLNNKILRKLSYHKGIVTSVSVSPDNKFIISGGTDKKVVLFDLGKNEVAGEFTDHQCEITSVKFSPDGSLIASAGSDGLIYIYNASNYKRIATLEGHKNWIRDISFSRDGKKLFSCGDDSKVITWNIEKLPSATVIINAKTRYVWLLTTDVNEDCETFVTGGEDGRIRIFSLFDKYVIRLGVPVNKVLFKPHEGAYIKVVAATRGKGVILVDLSRIHLT